MYIRFIINKDDKECRIEIVQYHDSLKLTQYQLL